MVLLANKISKNIKITPAAVGDVDIAKQILSQVVFLPIGSENTNIFSQEEHPIVTEIFQRSSI